MRGEGGLKEGVKEGVRRGNEGGEGAVIRSHAVVWL